MCQEEMDDEDEDAEYEEGMYENEDELEGEEELVDYFRGERFDAVFYKYRRRDAC